MLKANLCVESLHPVYAHKILCVLKLSTGLWITCSPGYQHRLRIFGLDNSLPTDKEGLEINVHSEDRVTVRGSDSTTVMKLTVSPLVKMLSALYGNQSFVTVFTTPRL